MAWSHSAISSRQILAHPAVFSVTPHFQLLSASFRSGKEWKAIGGYAPVLVAAFRQSAAR